MPRAAGHRWLLLALAVFFFCSGLSALVYQVLWLRMLGWVFGVTIYAASAVWATFMAGLAIGSYVAGIAGDRVRNPLRWFGATEILDRRDRARHAAAARGTSAALRATLPVAA